MCKWCDRVASVAGVCLKHYRKIQRNGVCQCGRPWDGLPGYGGFKPCLCGATPPPRVAKVKYKRGSGHQNKQLIRLLRSDEAGVAAKIRRLADIGERLHRLIDEVETKSDEARAELRELCRSVTRG